MNNIIQFKTIEDILNSDFNILIKKIFIRNIIYFNVSGKYCIVEKLLIEDGKCFYCIKDLPQACCFSEKYFK